MIEKHGESSPFASACVRVHLFDVADEECSSNWNTVHVCVCVCLYQLVIATTEIHRYKAPGTRKRGGKVRQ